MSKIQDAFNAIGRELFEHEKETVAAFKNKYKSALEIIRETQPADNKVFFHDRSRAPFESEQPVIDAAKEAMGDKRFFCPHDRAPRVDIPASLYKSVDDGLMERVLEIEQLMDRMSWSSCDLRVVMDTQMFECVYTHEDVKQTFQYFVGASSPEREDLAPGRRWIKISRTLFVEEK